MTGDPPRLEGDPQAGDGLGSASVEAPGVVRQERGPRPGSVDEQDGPLSKSVKAPVVGVVVKSPGLPNEARVSGRSHVCGAANDWPRQAAR